MQTFYNEENGDPYSINEYFTKEINDKHLLTTRHGGWVILEDGEFREFEEGEFEADGELFQKLEGEGIIITEDNREDILSCITKNNFMVLSPSCYHVIPVADSCNLNCKYCHPDAKPGKGLLDRDVAEDILDFIFSIPKLGNRKMKIVLTGGEPLMNYDVLQYITDESEKRAKDRKVNLNMSLVTNLTLMDDDIAKDLSKTDIDICTSLDGPKELHNKQRPHSSGKGSYEEVTYWTKRLRKKYKTRVSAIPVITKLSLDYGPKKFVNSYLENGFPNVFFKPYRPQGRAKENDELRMTPEEFFNFYRKGLEYCIKLRKKGVSIRERMTGEFMSSLLTPEGSSMCMRRPCGAGLSMLSYTTNGKVMACDSLRSIEEFQLGTVKDDYLEIRSNALPLISITPDVIPGCSNCPYNSFCGTCPGVAYGDYDDIFPKPPIDFECQWKKKIFDLLFEKIAKGEDDVLMEWGEKFSPNNSKMKKTI